jgi:leucine dehydrogenase
VGLHAVIAIDDTTHGPGFGGVRLRAYPDLRSGIIEAQRLAAAMTLKHAVADLPYGGAKSVIFANSLGPDRTRVMRRFGEFVARTAGFYMPGVDMGTTTADLRDIGSAGAAVACSELDPSPWTADGVLAAICAATEFAFASSSLTGRSVLVQGAGNVGGCLARRLREHGADVIVTDIDPDKARSVAAEVGGQVVAADDAVGTECDVFAPCGSARVITEHTVQRLRCRIVVGAANDPLSDSSLVESLARAEILYVPDFVSSAGGVIEVHGHRLGWDDVTLGEAVSKIGDRVVTLLDYASKHGVTPLESALLLARKALARSPRP